MFDLSLKKTAISTVSYHMKDHPGVGNDTLGRGSMGKRGTNSYFLISQDPSALVFPALASASNKKFL